MNNTDLSLLSFEKKPSSELHRRLKEDRKNYIKHNRWSVSATRTQNYGNIYEYVTDLRDLTNGRGFCCSKHI